MFRIFWGKISDMTPLTSLCAVLSLVSLPAFAQVPEVEFTGSGFLTLSVGKMLSGTRGSASGYTTPAFIADYAQAGVYDGRSDLQWEPDSKLGLQGTATLVGTDLSFTAQAVARGARDGNVNLEWLYGSYALSEATTLQIGRKRLPMFYYSDTQDIGFSMPWTHLPPQLYGWDVVNYNGVNLLHQASLGDWSAALNLLAGSEQIKDTGYWKIYNGKDSRTDVKWDHIIGGDLTLARDGFETRLAYIQSHTQEKNVTAGTDWGPTARQRIYGIAFHADIHNWLGHAEIIHIERPGNYYKDFAQIIAVGRRFGPWQLMATWSGYRAQAIISHPDGDPNGQEAHENRSLTLRYDLTPKSALKVQFDSQKEKGGPNWSPRYGDSRLITLAYDLVF